MHRFRAIAHSLVAPLGFYALAGALTAWFLWHGVNGQRGLKAGEEYEQQLAKLRLDRDILKLERMFWDHRISLIRGEEVDADILDDETRQRLGRVRKDELVILTPESGGGKAVH